MKRSLLLNLLQAYHPTDGEEREFKRGMLSFVEAYDHCFERTLEIGHVTASAWLLNSDGTKALLMHHAKLNMWVQPGGHCDGDHDVLRVALKETQEESGIASIIPVRMNVFDIDIHQIPHYKTTPAHLHYDVRFLLHAVGNDMLQNNTESKELRWIGKNSAELPTQERSIVRMFNKWQQLHSM